VFGEVDFALTDRLDLTVGVRFNEEEAEDYDITPTGAVMPELPDTNAVPDIFQGSKQVVGTAEFDSTTPRISLSYRWNDNLMGYVSYAEGFGAGGINVNPVLGVVPFDAEELQNLEVGLRSDWLDGRVRFNVTLYDGTWDGIQVSEAPPDPNNPGLSLPNPITTNAGQAEVDGIEIETIFAPNDNWRFDVNLGHLGTQYTDIGTTTQILLDSPFKLAPESSYSVGAQYRTELGNGGTILGRLDYGWMDEYYLSEALRQQRLQTSFGLLNARFQYEPPEANWRLSVFGTNLGDERYLNSGFLSGGFGVQAATVSRPREVGATLQFFFD
jgi:iron complex outermembrane receptor protein